MMLPPTDLTDEDESDELLDEYEEAVREGTVPDYLNESREEEG